MDFGEVKAPFRPLLDQQDHTFLNEVEGLSKPTSENLDRWIWRRLRSNLPSMSRVTVRDTCTSGCIYQGEDD